MDKITEIISNLNTEKVIQILIAIGVIIVFKILSSTISKIIIKIFRVKNKEKKDIKKNPFYIPLKVIITFIGIYIALNIVRDALEISEGTINLINRIIKILMILLVAKAFGQGLDERDGILNKIQSKTGKEVDETTTKLITKTIKVAIYVVAGFMVITELGYDISGFIAGLGIGGVVITLAAQDTAKSFIGGIGLFIDKPFKVGDYIKVGQYEGTVEEMKFRTTSIRTGENSVLHVPNSEMSISAIINYSEIQTRRINTELIIDINTNLDKMQKIKNMLQDMLNSYEIVKKDTIQVYFKEISANGMKISVIAYINESNYKNYMEIKEQINYNIIEILRSEGIGLSQKAQTVYVQNS